MVGRRMSEADLVSPTGGLRALALCTTLCALCAFPLGGSSPAAALVRFGPNVFIGGHDFSHQTFGPGRRAVIFLYPHTPRNAGCRWHADRRGGRVKVCHLRRL